MKKQLQYTTVFVVIIIGVLLGTLYLLNTSPALNGQSNQLTTASSGVDAFVNDANICNVSLTYDTSAKELNNNHCDT